MTKTDHEVEQPRERISVSGNVDRLSDDEIELFQDVFESNVEGDVGRRSTMGGILDKSAAGFASVRHERVKRIRTAQPDAHGNGGGGITEDVGFRNGEVFVKTPRHGKDDSSMEARLVAAAGKDKAGRAMLRDIGGHVRTLWLCYVWKMPVMMRDSLAAFESDVAPLVAETKAAKEAAGAQSPLAYCQALSQRILVVQVNGGSFDPADMISAQEIVIEADAQLAEACRAAKSSLRRHAAGLRLARAARLEAIADREGT